MRSACSRAPPRRPCPRGVEQRAHDRGLPLLRRDEQRGAAVLLASSLSTPASISTRTIAPCPAMTAGISGVCRFRRRAVLVGAGVEQRAHARFGALLGRVERGAAVVPRELLVGAGVEQVVHDREVAVHRRDVQARGVGLRVAEVDVRAAQGQLGRRAPRRRAGTARPSRVALAGVLNAASPPPGMHRRRWLDLQSSSGIACRSSTPPGTARTGRHPRRRTPRTRAGSPSVTAAASSGRSRNAPDPPWLSLYLPAAPPAALHDARRAARRACCAPPRARAGRAATSAGSRSRTTSLRRTRGRTATLPLAPLARVARERDGVVDVERRRRAPRRVRRARATLGADGELAVRAPRVRRLRRAAPRAVGLPATWPEFTITGTDASAQHQVHRVGRGEGARARARALSLSLLERCENGARALVAEYAAREQFYFFPDRCCRAPAPTRSRSTCGSAPAAAACKSSSTTTTARSTSTATTAPRAPRAPTRRSAGRCRPRTRARA